MKIEKIIILSMIMGVCHWAVAEPITKDNINRVLPSNPVMNTEYRNAVISAYLSAPTWDLKYRYDAAHNLMVPLHYAFERDNAVLKDMFNKHIEQFMTAGMSTTNVGQQFLYTIQYDYFLSRYVVLSKNKQPKLARHLYQDLEVAWKGPRFDLKNKLAWKLAHPQFNGYARAITDPEWYVFAIASDLLAVYPNDSMLKEIQSMAYQVFQQRGQFTESGGWLFDVGALDGHQDFAYAGYENADSVINPKPIRNATWDSSHFFRMPLILKSLSEAKQSVQQKNFYMQIRNGLQRQFFDKVLVRSSNGIKLNNFMDGRNGLYRWGYYQPNQGIGPYGLTAAFGIGWWAFLPGDKIKTVYRDYYPQLLAENNLKPNVVKVKQAISKNQKNNIEMNGYLILAIREVDTYLASQLR